MEDEYENEEASVRSRTRSGKRKALERKLTKVVLDYNINNNNNLESAFNQEDTLAIVTREEYHHKIVEEETVGLLTGEQYADKEITMVGETEERTQSPNLNGGSAPHDDTATPNGLGDIFSEMFSPADSASGPESFFKIRDMVVNNGPALETFHASGTCITDAQGITEVENSQDIHFHKPHAELLEEQHGVAPSGQMMPVLHRCRIKQKVKRVEPETGNVLMRGQFADSSKENKKRRTETHPLNQAEGSIASGGQSMVEEITQVSSLIASERPSPRVPLGAEETSKAIYLLKVQGLCREVYHICIAAYAKAAGILQEIRRLTKSQLTLQGENKKLMALLDAREQEHRATLEAKDKEYVDALCAKDPDYATLLATKEREYKDALEAKIAECRVLAASKDARIRELTEELAATKYGLAVSEAITDAAKASMVKAMIESVEIRGQLIVAQEKVHVDTSRGTALKVGLNGVEENAKN